MYPYDHNSDLLDELKAIISILYCIFIYFFVVFVFVVVFVCLVFFGRVVNTLNSGSGGPGFSLARRVVSLDKELYSTLPLFTQGRVVQSWVKITQG